MTTISFQKLISMSPKQSCYTKKKKWPSYISGHKHLSYALSQINWHERMYKRTVHGDEYNESFFLKHEGGKETSPKGARM